jgi:Tol biopolymer transport system component
MMLLSKHSFRVSLIGIMVFLLVACNQSSATPTVILPTAPMATKTVAIIPPTVSLPTAMPPPPPSPTFLPTATPTAPPTPTITPLPPTATPIPFQPGAEMIGQANCCQEFNFSSDGKFYYYDKPQASGRAGTYVYDLNSKQSTFLIEQFGSFSPDLSLLGVSRRDRGTTLIQQVKDGSTLATLQNKGENVVFSPDNSRLAYLLRLPTPEGASAPQRFELWVGEVNGTNLRAVWTLREGDNLAWFPDNRRLLLTARDPPNQRFGLWVIDTQAPPAQAANLIVESKGLILARLSANAKNIAYGIALQGDVKSGLWLIDENGTNPTKLSWQGSWEWSRAKADELFYVPVRSTGETSSSLWSYNVSTNQSTRLIDPNLLPLQIAENQMRISPDGKSLIYRKTGDYSLWRLRFRP